MKKKIICLALSCFIIVSNIANIYGATHIYINSIIVPNISLEIKEGTTFVPIRAISETLGYSVVYNEKNKEINVGNKFTHKIGESFVKFNDGTIEDIGITSYVKDGTTYVPLRLFSQSLGYTVNYDEKSKNIFINEEIEKTEDNITINPRKMVLLDVVRAVRREEINATNKNEIGIYTENSDVNVTDTTVNKVGDSTDITNIENGLNSAVSMKDSNLVSRNFNIKTNAVGAIGLFLDSTKAEMKISTINTIGLNSDALNLKNNSSISLDDFTIKTLGEDSTAISAKDSNVNLNNGVIVSQNSSLIKSDSKINLSNIEGKSKLDLFTLLLNGDLTVFNSKLETTEKAFKIGNTANHSTVNINLQNSEIKSNALVGFDVQNTDLNINLSNTTFNNFKTLIDFKNNSEIAKTLNLKAIEQVICGNIKMSANTKANITLSDSSNFIGSINAENLSSVVIVDITGVSTWDVTGNSYVKVINPTDQKYTNINSNGYNVYYDANDKRNAWLNEKKYTLNGGGYLMPVK